MLGRKWQSQWESGIDLIDLPLVNVVVPWFKYKNNNIQGFFCLLH